MVESVWVGQRRKKGEISIILLDELDTRLAMWQWLMFSKTIRNIANKAKNKVINNEKTKN